MTAPVDVAIVGAGPSGTVLGAALAHAGIEVLIVEQAPRLALASRGCVHLAGGGERARASRPLPGDPGRGRPAHPGDAPRDAWRCGGPSDLRRGSGRPAGGRLRSVAAGPRARGPGSCGRGRDPARDARRWRRARPSRPGDAPPRRRAGSGARRRRRGWDGLGRRARRRRPSRTAVAATRRAVLACPGSRPRDPGAPGPSRDARLVVIEDGYVGLAPVPGDRLNIGIVLGPSWREELARTGAAATSRRVLAMVPPADDDPVAWAGARALRSHRRGRAARRSRHGAGRTRLVPGRRRGRVPRPVHGRGAPSCARVDRARRGRRSGRQPSAAGRSGQRLRAPTIARCVVGSPRRTPSRGSSRRSWLDRGRSSTPPDGWPSGPRSVRPWAS